MICKGLNRIEGKLAPLLTDRSYCQCANSTVNFYANRRINFKKVYWIIIHWRGKANQPIACQLNDVYWVYKIGMGEKRKKWVAKRFRVWGQTSELMCYVNIRCMRDACHFSDYQSNVAFHELVLYVDKSTYILIMITILFILSFVYDW